MKIRISNQTSINMIIYLKKIHYHQLKYFLFLIITAFLTIKFLLIRHEFIFKRKIKF